MEKGIKEYWVVSIGWLLMVEINEDREFRLREIEWPIEIHSLLQMLHSYMKN